MKCTSQSILYYAIQHKGDWSKIAQCIKNEEPYEKVEVESNYVTILDPNYPPCFKRLRYPPWILFYYGNLSLLDDDPIGIVGARQCSQSAIQNTFHIVGQIKKRHTIVSGLAKGIDASAHWAALDHKTVGFIGCGIERIYPKENDTLFTQMKTNHCVCSEYPGHTAPLRHHFPWRNRLIAASCKALIVVEAKYKSGTMLTVDACNELGVPVYCVPAAFSDPQYKGCNYLISCGAQILLEEDLERF